MALAACGGAGTAPAQPAPSSHTDIARLADGSYQFRVDGAPQALVGVGYNALYDKLPRDQRADNYRRDFALMRDAGVNAITGWDADKGYQQDVFDEQTLKLANEYGIGVIMPLNLPPSANYADQSFVNGLLAQARGKIQRFKSYPALRMWGVGNEVFWGMPAAHDAAFEQAYLKIADLFHQLDPNHPVIYRGAEDQWVPRIVDMLRGRDRRPWLIYGMNVFNKNLSPLLGRWPGYGLERPVVVSEYGAKGATPADRARRTVDMWRQIRSFDRYVLGGFVYAWTTAGPEPTDTVWGLMDGQSKPVDDTWRSLADEWRREAQNPGAKPSDEPLR